MYTHARALAQKTASGKGMGLGSKPKRLKYHDLDFLIGTWSSKKAEEFDENVKIFEKIDDELWK